MFNLIIYLGTFIACFYCTEMILNRKDNVFNQVFCPPGGGKTTLTADITRKALKENKKVFSNKPIIGAYRFEMDDLGKYEIRDCVLLIDEAGSELSNRNWQNNLNMNQITTLKLHRHLNIDIWLFSQASGDVDNKFRELTTGLYMLKKSIIPFRIVGKAIKKTVDLINGQIVDFYEYDPLKNIHFWTVPNWAYFNTAQVEEKLPRKCWTRYRKEDCE